MWVCSVWRQVVLVVGLGQWAVYGSIIGVPNSRGNAYVNTKLPVGDVLGERWAPNNIIIRPLFQFATANDQYLTVKIEFDLMDDVARMTGCSKEEGEDGEGEWDCGLDDLANEAYRTELRHVENEIRGEMRLGQQIARHNRHTFAQFAELRDHVVEGGRRREKRAITALIVFIGIIVFAISVLAVTNRISIEQNAAYVQEMLDDSIAADEVQERINADLEGATMLNFQLAKNATRMARFNGLRIDFRSNVRVPVKKTTFGMHAAYEGRPLASFVDGGKVWDTVKATMGSEAEDLVYNRDPDALLSVSQIAITGMDEKRLRMKGLLVIPNLKQSSLFVQCRLHALGHFDDQSTLLIPTLPKTIAFPVEPPANFTHLNTSQLIRQLDSTKCRSAGTASDIKFVCRTEDVLPFKSTDTECFPPLTGKCHWKQEPTDEHFTRAFQYGGGYHVVTREKEYTERLSDTTARKSDMLNTVSITRAVRKSIRYYELAPGWELVFGNTTLHSQPLHSVKAGLLPISELSTILHNISRPFNGTKFRTITARMSKDQTSLHHVIEDKQDLAKRMSQSWWAWLQAGWAKWSHVVVLVIIGAVVVGGCCCCCVCVCTVFGPAIGCCKNLGKAIAATLGAFSRCFSKWEESVKKRADGADPEAQES